MDSVNSFGNSHFEEEADIIHFRQDSENHDDENHPSRPVSRLGFNRLALSPERHESHNSEAIQWSRSLFQSIGISNLRLSNLKTHSENAFETDAFEDDILDSAHSTSDIGESNIPNLSEDFESPYGNEDMTKYAMVVRKPSTSPLPVSRLSFPFVTTPSPRRDKSTPSLRPARRHKYSCFPSSMSPEPAAHLSPSHPRYSYRQHGYSRLALQHLKWFWSLREHEWEASNTDLRNINPNDVSDVEPVVDVPAPYAYVVRTSPTTIHPRRGDITALRDPFSFHMDRYFSDLASWTFGKILWMIDMHAAMEKRKMEADLEQDVSDEESESELETSASTGFSDDSDSTLVESESEGDLLNLKNAILDPSIPMINDDAEPPQVLSVGYLDNTNWSQSVYTHISKSKRLDRKDLPWATNWYGRWAFLVDIYRPDKNRKHLLFDPTAPPIEFIANIKDDTGPHFTLAGKHKYLETDELWASKL